MKPKTVLFFLFLNGILFAQNTKLKSLNDSVFVVGDVVKVPATIYSTCSPYTRAEDFDSIKPIADFLKKTPGIVVEIASHSDIRGSAANNLKLTQARAEQMKNDLVEHFKCDPKQVIAKGYGESKLLVSDAEILKVKAKEEKEMLHQKNRRTELIVVKVDD